VLFGLLAAIIWAAFPVRAQDSEPRLLKEHALGPKVKMFNNYSKDFEAMEQPLHGEELQVVEFLEQVAKTAEDRLYALDAQLRMYDSVSCKDDRAKVKNILKGQLDYYSWLFDSEIKRTTGGLTYSKIPVAAQEGLRMKDDLRAAKEKLDAISASLD
jgi:hypothetical protein